MPVSSAAPGGGLAFPRKFSYHPSVASWRSGRGSGGPPISGSGGSRAGRARLPRPASTCAITVALRRREKRYARGTLGESGVRSVVHMSIGIVMDMYTLALLAQKGGMGKTTLAINLAVVAETEGRRAVLIDLDPQASAASWGDHRDEDAPVDTAVPAARLHGALGAARAHGAIAERNLEVAPQRVGAHVAFAASGQTQVWSATLAPKAWGPTLGCNKNRANGHCSSSPVLSGDDFSVRAAATREGDRPYSGDPLQFAFQGTRGGMPLNALRTSGKSVNVAAAPAGRPGLRGFLVGRRQHRLIHLANGVQPLADRLDSVSPEWRAHGARHHRAVHHQRHRAVVHALDPACQRVAGRGGRHLPAKRSAEPQRTTLGPSRLNAVVASLETKRPSGSSMGTNRAMTNRTPAPEPEGVPGSESLLSPIWTAARLARVAPRSHLVAGCVVPAALLLLAAGARAAVPGTPTDLVLCPIYFLHKILELWSTQGRAPWH